MGDSTRKVAQHWRLAMSYRTELYASGDYSGVALDPSKPIEVKLPGEIIEIVQYFGLQRAILAFLGFRTPGHLVNRLPQPRQHRPGSLFTESSAAI